MCLQLFHQNSIRWGCLLATLALVAGGWSSAAGQTRPEIISVHAGQSGLQVTVHVPPGLRRVTLEGRQHLTVGAWEPRAVEHLDGTGDTITFTISTDGSSQVLRVRANENEPLPNSFYGGTRTFNGRRTTEQIAGSGAPDLQRYGISTHAANLAFNALSVDSGAEARVVQESDIWKVQGQTLYYFNQYRGLQVIDLSNPDAPVVQGVLSLPAAGEEMHLLGSNHVVLQAHRDCQGTGGDSEIVVVQVRPLPLVRAASLTVPGRITASRLVGRALYVASESWHPRTNATGEVAWEQGTHVRSFDLADPAAPIARATRWYPGGGNVISATERFLFVAVATNNSGSDVHCLDISAPNGEITTRGTARANGQVTDKFKIHLHGEVLTIVSWGLNASSVSVTKVQTFSLTASTGPTKVGEVHLGVNEQLFATRFDGTLLYAVTYRRVDPLWVVDLSNPAQPRIAGELHVPGWSTYIQPWGNRLVTVGIDDVNGSRIAAQLFDVSDPAHPTLLSKVSLGENHSWSEASSNEKAVQILPEAGLILLPYQGWDTNGYASRVQLIDLTRNTLRSRGVIEHEFQPRRSIAQGNKIFSISGRELLSVDATNRDLPVTLARLTLAWAVDQVFHQGEHLLQLTSSDAILWVTPADSPDRVLAAFELTNRASVVGATLRDGKLYVAQQETQRNHDYFFAMPFFHDRIGGATTNAPLHLSIFDVSRLPAVSLLGTAESPTGSTGFDGTYEPAWPASGLLVWAGSERTAYYWWDLSPIWQVRVTPGRMVLNAPPLSLAPPGFTPDAVTVSPPGGLWAPPSYYPRYRADSEQWLVAFDVQDAASPRHVSSLNLGTNGGHNFSRAHTEAGSVFYSHQQDDRVVTGTNYDVQTRRQTITETNLVLVANLEPVYTVTIVTNFSVPSIPGAGMVRRTWPAGTRFFAGGYHNLAVLPDGAVWSWGANTAAQLGDGRFVGRSDAVNVDGAGVAATAAAGGFHSMVVRGDGTVMSWGHYSYGQLGFGVTTPDPFPAPPFPPSPGVLVPTLALGWPSLQTLVAGDYHSIGLTAAGTVYTSGGNWNGQLGDGTLTTRFQPGRVAGLTNVIAVAAGSRHTIALLADGSVVGWGQIGLGGSDVGVVRPTRIPSLENIVAIAAGGRHSLALHADGSVTEWGDIDAAGDATTSAPHKVAGLSEIVSIDAGFSHRIALRQDGSVWAWGQNDRGQLGLASITSLENPRPIAELQQVSTIVAGGYHSIAARADGMVWVWGDDRIRQLGTGEVRPLSDSNPVLSLVYLTNISFITNLVWQENITERWENILFTNIYEVVTWVERQYLDVIDYSDPVHPTVRAPISLPGQLKGLSHGGALLYTLGARESTKDVIVTSLDAVAYDDVSVSLVDSVPLREGDNHSVLVIGATVYLARSTYTNAILEAWIVSETSAHFTLRSSQALSGPVQSLFDYPDLLALQTDGRVRLLNPTTLSEIGQARLLPCGGEDLRHADGDATHGLWVPLGAFGVGRVRTQP